MVVVKEERKSTCMMLVHEIHVFELQIETNVYDPSSFQRYLSSSEKGLNGTRTLTSAMLVQCSTR